MTKPEKAPKRAPATWTVYERLDQVNVVRPSTNEAGDGPGVVLSFDATVLVQHANNVKARTGADACWWVAENSLKDRAQGDSPPVLCASRNGTAHGLTEARPYALKATVERVR